MKSLFALIALTFVSFAANATWFYKSGTVNTIGASDSSNGTDLDYMYVNNLSSAGNCPKNSSGFVILIIRGDAQGNRLYIKALNALTTGVAINISINDAAPKSPLGYCYAQTIY